MPARLDSGASHYAVPQFECFGAVLRKAANWIQMQQRVRVTNVQSIDYKLKHEAGMCPLLLQEAVLRGGQGGHAPCESCAPHVAPIMKLVAR